jgi:hypothetical protein
MNKKEKRQQRAEDFKNQKVKDVKNFNYDQHNRKGVEGTHISGQEAKFVRQTGGLDAAHASLQAQKDAGATFGKRAQNKFDRMGKRIEKRDARREAKERASNVKPAVEPDTQNINLPQPAASGNQPVNQEASVKNSQSQEIKQDNDQSSVINGNNNIVNQQQDNSIRQYGGDNRSLIVQNAGGGSTTQALDGVATAGTLAGLWDANDSPGAKASRVDQAQTMNADAQKRYANTSSIAQGAIAMADQNRYIDPAKLDQRVHDRAQYHKSNATAMGGNIFGDLFGQKAPDWNSPDPAKPVEKPDFEGMYDKYTDF